MTVKCEIKLCDKTYPNHKWGRIKAKGWFIELNGRSWCPDHIPEWVASWRARKKEKK